MAGQAETGTERPETDTDRVMVAKPSPEFGEGNRPEPSPESGEGAFSNLRGEPSPIWGPSLLQPTGEKPVINQKRTSAPDGTAPDHGFTAPPAAEGAAPSAGRVDNSTDRLVVETPSSGDDGGAAPAAGAVSAEPDRSNRDRIRDLLFNPLGFRFPRGTDAEKGKAMLNRIADDLAYLSDESLAALLAMIRTKGEGSSRCFWPPRATFLAIAEYIQPRPVEDIPALCSWFGSVEGPKAAGNGILVETFLFIEARKLPPVADGAMRQITAQARENARRLLIVDERTAAGLAIAPDELAFARWYREKLAFCQALMEAERRKRGHDVGARP